jgi:hypothetical protein
MRKWKGYLWNTNRIEDSKCGSDKATSGTQKWEEKLRK